MAKKVYIGVNNVARQVKKVYFGVSNVARKVKKAYIGIGGVARQVFSSEVSPVMYSGTSTQLSSPVRISAAYGNTTSYAVVAGGAIFTGSSVSTATGDTATVEAYNSSLTKTTGSSLTTALDSPGCVSLSGGTMLVAGGCTYGCWVGSEWSIYKTVDIISNSLTKSSAAEYPQYIMCTNGTRSSDGAIFAGGYEWSGSGSIYATNRAVRYTYSGTKSSLTTLSAAQVYLSSASVSSYSLFCCFGTWETTPSATVDVYNGSSKVTSLSLSKARFEALAASTSNYAMILGGEDADHYSCNKVDAYNSSLVRTSFSLPDNGTVSVTPARHTLPGWNNVGVLGTNVIFTNWVSQGAYPAYYCINNSLVTTVIDTPSLYLPEECGFSSVGNYCLAMNGIGHPNGQQTFAPNSTTYAFTYTAQ